MGRQPRPPDLRVTSTGLPLQVCELRAGGLRIGWWRVVGGSWKNFPDLNHSLPTTDH